LKTVKERVIAFIILFSMILIMVPRKTEAKGYTNNIDVGLAGMGISVEGKKISTTKEPFIYEGEIWVPLGEVGKGLEMRVTFSSNHRTVYLNSNGKLNTSENSKELSSFIKGYEIENKEKRVKNIDKELESIENDKKYISEDKFPVIKTEKNISVYFGDVSVILDGRNLKFDKEPLIYNDDVYVPIISIAGFLYITPSYNPEANTLEIDSNGVLINKKIYSSLDKLSVFRNSRDIALDMKLVEMEERKWVAEGLGIPYKNISTVETLQSYLNNYMYKLGNISPTIKVEKTMGKWLYVAVSFPQNQNSNWNKLQRRDVENWIWDLYSIINNLYRESPYVYGVIRNPYYDEYSSSVYKNYVMFETTEDNIDFDFSKSNLKKDYRVDISYLVDALIRNLEKYKKIEFSYDGNMNGNEVNLEITPNSDDMYSWKVSDKIAYLKRLNSEISKVKSGLIVNGKIIFSDEDKEPIRFSIEDGKIISEDLLRETEEYLNSNYGSFDYKDYSYNLNYSIYQEDSENLRLVAEGDFSLQDKGWKSYEEKLSGRMKIEVENAISYTMSLWARNIFTEVYDNEMNPIDQIDIYNKTVGPVYANPSEGEIEKGTKVYLYTDTSDARIFYTLDGSEPNTGSSLYTAPIEVTRDLEIRAFGWRDGYGSGPISSFEYKIEKEE